MNELDAAIAAQPVNLSCSRCGHNFTKTLGEIERDGQVTCPGCGDIAQLDQALTERLAAVKQQLAQGIADSGEALDRLTKDLNRRMKR